MADNPWATTTTSAIAESLGVFIFDERSGRTQAVEVEGVESVAVQTKFAVESAVPAPADPTPGLSPLLWYDFADESTVSVSGGQVAQINSKGSTAWSLTKSAIGPNYVTGINGRKCADWGSSSHSNYLNNPSTTSTTMAEFYLVLDASFGSLFPDFNCVISTLSQWSVTGFAGRDGFYVDAFGQAYINGSSVNVYSGTTGGAPSGILPAVNTPSLLRIVGSGANTTSGFQLAMDRSIAGRGWYGLMGEVIVFSSPLSTQDRTTLQNWLASKWGITLS